MTDKHCLSHVGATTVFCVLLVVCSVRATIRLRMLVQIPLRDHDMRPGCELWGLAGRDVPGTATPIQM